MKKKNPLGQQAIPLTDLPIPPIRQVQQSVKEQVEWLDSSLKTLLMAKSRFSNSRNVLTSFNSDNNDKETLVPITESLFVKGKLHSNKVLIDIGVGYFVERTPNEAKDFFDRKIKFVEDKMNDIQKKKLNEQTNNLSQIESVLSSKIAEYAKQDTVKENSNDFLKSLSGSNESASTNISFK